MVIVIISGGWEGFWLTCEQNQNEAMEPITKAHRRRAF